MPAKASGDGPSPCKDVYPLVKPDQPSTSTINTHSQWNSSGNHQVVFTVSVAAAALSAHALLHVSLPAGAVIAVALLRPQTLLGMLYGVLIAVGGMIYVPLKGKDPSDYLTRALANIANAISARELIPAGALTPPAREAGTQRPPAAPEPAVASVSVLPPATNAARNQDEPMYWSLIQEKVYAPGGRPDIVPQPARGRHARPEPSITVDKPAEAQLARAA